MTTIPDRRYGTARDINPDAGTHAISADPDEQKAADAATRQSWREFPYYARRYGERGWKFSLSDSGWLTTLSDASDSAAIAQTEWLAAMLAARGMPRYLLERHLMHLHAALAERVPGRIAQYGALIKCSAALTSARIRHIPGDDFRRIAREFENRVANLPERVPNLGVVLVAAVADDADGVAGVADSVAAWALDPAKVEPVWFDAVNAALSAARAVSLEARARG